MKLLLTFFLLTGIIFSQSITKEDSVKIKDITDKYQFILKEYQSTDSLQIKRQGILQFLQSEYSDVMKKYQKPPAKKEGK